MSRPSLEDVYLELTGGEEVQRMSDARLALRQVGYTNKAFWRNPASAFFTFAFPLMFLVIFTVAARRGDVTASSGVTIGPSTYYVVGDGGVRGDQRACYTNIAISMTFHRDAGILKRTRGTPLPAWAYMSGRVIHAMIVGVHPRRDHGGVRAVVLRRELPTGLPLLQFLVTLSVGAARSARWRSRSRRSSRTRTPRRRS